MLLPPLKLRCGEELELVLGAGALVPGEEVAGADVAGALVAGALVSGDEVTLDGWWLAL